MTDNLNNSEWREVLRRLRKLETTQNMGFSSVSRGCSRFVGEKSIWIQGSGLVDGRWVVNGRLEGSGTLDWLGPWYLRGQGEITGDLKLTGDVQVTGDFEVLGNGKIRVGNMVIDPSVGGGSIVFANGAQVFSDGNSIQVYKGNSVMQVKDGSATMQTGGVAVQTTSAGLNIFGVLPQVSGTGSEPGTLIRGAGGVIYEATS